MTLKIQRGHNIKHGQFLKCVKATKQLTALDRLNSKMFRIHGLFYCFRVAWIIICNFAKDAKNWIRVYCNFRYCKMSDMWIRLRGEDQVFDSPTKESFCEAMWSVSVQMLIFYTSQRWRQTKPLCCTSFWKNTRTVPACLLPLVKQEHMVLEDSGSWSRKQGLSWLHAIVDFIAVASELIDCMRKKSRARLSTKKRDIHTW